MAAPSQIHHVRYDDFFRLVSPGVGDLTDFRSAVDHLMGLMGDPQYHHVLIDLRHATVEPIPEVLLVEAMSYLQSWGLGCWANKVAVVVDRDDLARVARAEVLARIAQAMEMRLCSFDDYGRALDWLSEKAPPPL
jgi:hypothetical protein